MLRALFILLAIVSFLLAIVLRMPELYVAAGALVIASGAILIASARKQHEKSKKSYLASTPSGEQDDDLAALGIGEIKPVQPRTSKTADSADDLRVQSEPSEEAVPVASDSLPGSDPEREVDEPVGVRRIARGGENEDREHSGREKEEVQAADGTNDELRALGIMEIRPRERKPSSPVFQLADAAAESSDDHGSGNGTGARPVTTSSIHVRRKKDEPDSPEEAAARERLRREVLTPYLQSLQAAVGANTICLLKQDEIALKYHIVAIVSKNGYARSQGYFTTRVPLLTPAISRRPVLTFRVGEKGIPTANLGYYIEPIAVKQIAVTDVPQLSTVASYFLLADTMEESGLGATRQHALLAQFARVLGAVLDGGEMVALDEEMPDIRPRRDIIAEEMHRARAEQRPLALVLLYLNMAEEIAADGDESVNEAEAILEGRLREVAGDRRIEHFGELIYGVFYSAEATTVEPWVVSLQEQLRDESGPLEAGVSIGIALLKDRHLSPESLRADATEALREAYETGACTILE